MIWFDHDGVAQPGRPGPLGHAVAQREVAARWDAGVEALALQVEADVARDDASLHGAGDRAAAGGNLRDREDHPRRHVGREVVPDAPVDQPQHRPDLADGDARWIGVDRDAAAHHRRIVDSAPEMAPLWHVACLAGDALGGIAAAAPLDIGVLQLLAVQRRNAARELVAGCAEPGTLEGGRCGPAAVWLRVGPPAACSRPRRRAEVPVAAHMARRATQTVAPRHAAHAVAPWQRPPPLQCAGERALLLGQRRMAAQTILVAGMIGGGEGLHLPEQPWPEGMSVARCRPVAVLRDMAGAARSRIERGLERGVGGRRRPLRGQRPRPVVAKKT